MATLREPAVAGLFYPADRDELHDAVTALLGTAMDSPRDAGPPPKALIVPHAGYVYSGPVAATAYRLLGPVRERIRRVVLLGPAHRVAFPGLAATRATRFRTPLGDVPVDTETVTALLELPQVRLLDEAHAMEHSLEVHLPFLQEALAEFEVVPLVVGDASPEEVGAVLEKSWGGDETLIVISSDLSHYHDYDTARRLDAATSAAIADLAPERIAYDHACGRNPINGLLHVARTRGLACETLDVRNSGDTAGSRDHVVGYGAYAFH
ncbi:MAG: AmmeMemoRadiSam system protein B [Gammaproteobacteria bacterium]|nr:AmmeMemoRadiSam system protein B [Gammaproteobacteria bacterium]